MANYFRTIVFIILYSLTIACNNKDSSIIKCDCEEIQNSHFIGSTDCDRFNDKNFENITCQSNQHFKSGKYSVMLTNGCPYGMTYSLKGATAKEHFRIAVWRHVANKGGCLVASAENVDDLYLVQPNSNNIIQGDWEHLFFDLIIPESASGKKILIYAWNAGDSLPVFFDDMSIEYVSKEVVNRVIKSSSFIDSRDGQKYETVKIGDEWWMAENLNYKIHDSCRCYGNNETNCNEYGKLYDFNSACSSCPEGWKMPSDNDWKRLEKNIGMSVEDVEKYGDRGYDESIKLREFGATGFDAKQAGAFVDSGFFNLHRSAYFWTSTEIDSVHAYCREISHRLDVGRFKDAKKMNFSVRCIQIK